MNDPLPNSKSKFFQRLAPFIFSCLFFIFLMEILLQGSARLGQRNQFTFPDTFLISKGAWQYDAQLGYRWQPGKWQTLRVVNGQAAYFNKATINPQGWESHRHYRAPKASPSIFRLVILGDSFTNGLFLDKTWGDRLQELINKSEPKMNIEIFSFGSNGGGLLNWHEIFFKEIAPKYDFDGLIIASYDNNLFRPKMVIHEHGGWFGMGRYKADLKYPKTSQEFFKNYGDGLYPTGKFIDSNHLNAYGLCLTKSNPCPPAFYTGRIAKTLWKLVDGKWAKTIERRINRGFTNQYLASWTGQEIIHQKLHQIVDWTSHHGKKLAFVSVPKKEVFLKGKKRQNLRSKDFHAFQLSQIANAYHAPFFDGYSAYKFYRESKVGQEFFFNLDDHWTQKGSDVFANWMNKVLIKNPPQTWPTITAKGTQTLIRENIPTLLEE